MDTIKKVALNSFLAHWGNQFTPKMLSSQLLQLKWKSGGVSYLKVT